VTSRQDVVFDFNPSPRIMEVDVPSVEINLQDLVDTIRINEDSFVGQTYNEMLKASGKEPLGGGVLVGITGELQNTLLAFARRDIPAQSGTATSSTTESVGKITLIDTAATFITNGLKRGSFVINYTDQSTCDVFSVDSETQITCTALLNGTDNDFDSGDAYDIFNVIQVKATGGNLVAVDSVGSPIAPVLPTAFTQVVIELSSSATLIQSDKIDELYTLAGLEKGNAVTITPTTITDANGKVTINLTGDGVTTTTKTKV